MASFATEPEKGCSMPNFFLDSVPEELLDNVLRFFSRIPATEKWEAHIPLRDLIPLYGIVGVLGGILQRRFHTLCISRTIDCADEHDNYKWKLRNTVPALWTSDIRVAREFVMAGGGKSLRTLVVGANMYNSKRDGANLVDEFLASCPNVDELSVEEFGTHWVARFGEQITHLEIATDTCAGVSEHCGNLHELNLYLFKNDAEASMTLWKNVNITSKLENLSVPGRCLSAQEINAIRENCGHLKRIRIPARKPANKTAIVRLLSSYGPQLKYAYIENLTDYQLSYLVDSCKNAKFYLDLDFSTPSAATLNRLGPQLDKISMGGAPLNEDGIGEVNVGWNKCINMQGLTVKGCNVRTMTDIMAVPKKQLKSLNIVMGIRENKDDVKTIMELAADGTEQVVSFAFDGPKASDDNAFDNFIRKNRNTLRTLSIPGDKLKRTRLTGLREVLLKKRIPSKMIKGLEERGVTPRGVFYTL